ncbi:hypothetical protein FA13DRAFT_1749008 [Coprinellus micaceus]|uniref:Uncharacterized protein n=1 Tax=Coprinellus micaceus TaxID=71717 RepID=A0A4Y7RMU0_COPMI|nr:hypothetical protein FA13DRAFT_1749008 [Coprinellus micaceus]
MSGGGGRGMRVLGGGEEGEEVLLLFTLHSSLGLLYTLLFALYTSTPSTLHYLAHFTPSTLHEAGRRRGGDVLAFFFLFGR